ncbi:MAG: HEAT repeat domain-containing protein [Vicinamibacteria bacterium]
MGSLVVIAVGGLVAWAALRLAMLRREARLRSWRKAAADAGLEGVAETERFFGHELTGRSGPLAVKFERFQRGGGKGPAGTRIEIAGLGHGDFGLAFRREGLGARLDRVLTGERDIETGDASFDREVFVSGRPSLAHAVLGAEARAAVLALARGRIPVPGGPWVEADVEVDRGKIKVEITESVFDDAERPAVSGALVLWLLDAARRLAAPESVPVAIAVRAAADPEPGVRLASVRHLIEAFGSDPSTRPALLGARTDPDARVRVEAAQALGDDGVETLLGVVREERTEDALRARAILALGGRLPVDLATVILGRAGDAAQRASGLACVDVLGATGPQALAAPRRRCRRATARWPSRRAGLARVGESSAEALVAALADPRPAVRVAAAESLGRVGSVEVVPLPRRRRALGRWRDAARGAAGRREHPGAVAGAEPGQLSLAGGESGQLSLADESGAGGEVSLVEEPAEAPLEPLPSAPEPIADEEEASPAPRPQRPGTIQGKT